MRRHGIRLCWVGLLALGACRLLEAQVPYLEFRESEVKVRPGGTFSVNLDLVVGVAVPGDFSGEVRSIEWWLGTTTEAKGMMSVESWTFESAWSVPQFGPTPPQLLEVDNGAGEWRTAGNLGTTAKPTVVVDANTHAVSKIAVLIDAALPPGDYSLFTTAPDPLFGWSDSEDNIGGMSARAYVTVHVQVPEPGTYALVGGIGLLGFAAYRRWTSARG